MLHVHAFSQEDKLAIDFHNSAEFQADKNPAKAFQLLERAISMSRTSQDWDLYIKSLNKLAALDFTGRDEMQDQAFSLMKRAAASLKDADESYALAEYHFNTAELYNKLTIEIDSPIYHYERAKKIWIALKGELTEEVSNCYHGLGDIYKYYKFDFHEAEECYEKALLIRDKIKFQHPVALYKNYYSLAATNRSQRDFEKALSYGSRALEVAKKVGADKTELVNGLIANIYRDMNQPELAKKFYLNALLLNERTKELEARAWYFLSLGETFKNDSLYKEALAYFKKAHALYVSPDVNDTDLFLQLLISMLDTYSMVGDEQNFEKTRKEIFQALKSLGKLGGREAAEAWLFVGDHHKRNMRYDSALVNYQKAMLAAIPSFHSKNLVDNPTYEMIGSRYYLSGVLTKKASALNEKFVLTGNAGYLDQSLMCLKLAEKLIAEQRNTLDIEEAKWEFSDSNYDVYEEILSNLYKGLKLRHADTAYHLAFEYFERSKSRSLADALTEAERTKQISGDDSLFRLHAGLKRQLFRTQDLINRELEKSNGSPRISGLRSDIVMLDQRIQLAKVAIEEKYPGYFNVKYGYDVAPLQAVQEIMDKKKRVLLEYFWGNESVYGLGVADKEVLFVRIGSPDSVSAYVNQLLVHLTDERSSMNSELYRSFTTSAHSLYNELIGPFQSVLKGKNKVHVIPDGSIGQVPFEIMLEEMPAGDIVNYRSLKYMIKSFTVGYAYSSSMVIHDSEDKPAANPSLLAMGFTTGRQLRSADYQLEDIQGAEQELKALEKYFREGKFLAGEEATESNFKALAPTYDILHLAIHGMGDVERKFAASLYFGSKFDSINDGELHAYELYGLKLKATMAVLSSCESGLGKGYKGEGMVSMASAFTYSGCKNILMSLWKVNDQAATTLMGHFYKNILKGESLDHSLRIAKLNYLESSDELTADPKIWSSLVVYGNLDSVVQKQSSKSYIVITFLVIAAALFFMLRFYNKRSQVK